jgi:WD40 repeat protein
LLINHDDTASYWLPGGTAPVASFTYESGGMRPDDQGTLVFSPDGAGLAGPGPWTAPGNLRTWSARDGRLLREAPAHPDVIDALAWSPDGNFIATAGPDDSVADAGDDAGSDMRVVKVWTVADRRVLYTLMGHADLISSVAFSPDGTLLASADREGRVRLWSRADGALVRELASPPTQTGLTLDRFNGSVAFSPDGQFLASRAVHWIATGHSVYIAIFRVADGTIARELRGFGDGNLGELGWSPDGRYLIGGAGPELRVWCMTPDAGGPTDAGGA